MTVAKEPLIGSSRAVSSMLGPQGHYSQTTDQSDVWFGRVSGSGLPN